MTSVAAEILCGTRVVFTVSVVPVAPGDGTTGTVTIFVDGTSTVATLRLDGFGRASFDIDVPAGTHSLTADFNGDGDFNGSISTPIVLTR